MDDELKELLDSFVVETNEILETLDQELMSLESSPDDMDLLNSIFRSFHTIKGTSSFMGFDQITKITHVAEDVLNKLRKSEIPVTSATVDVLLEVYDWLKILAKQIDSGEQTPVDFHNTIAKLQAISQGQDPSSASGPAPEEHQAPTAAPEAAADDNADAIAAIFADPAFGSSGDDFSPEEYALLEQAFKQINTSFKHDDPEAITGDDTDSELALVEETTPDAAEPTSPEPATLLSPEAIETVSAPTEQSPAPRAEARPQPSTARQETKPAPKTEAPKQEQNTARASSSAVDNTIRVDVDRLETLMDLSGELVLGRNRLAQITHDLAQKYDNHDFIRELVETSSQINFITTELQSAIMKTRMVPIAKLFQKAPRMVRDLSKEFGKEINLILKGEETELDRSIIEELNDPLVHMIRNSCDHGVETPQEREAKGKPRAGTVTLDAEHEGNHIVIRISDDGKGMDAEKLKAKAVEKGVITPEQAAQMSAREAYNLIFAAGFSTAEKVTSVSGRGVGMDVVRTNIQKLKGMIEIDSQQGQGSTFTIKLPLTLAIIQGLLVAVQDEIYAIPLSSVVEVVSADKDNVYTVNQNEVIRIREEVYPLLRLDKTLRTPTLGQSIEDRYVVIVGLASYRIGLVVDGLLGQKEIVIKSLGEYLGQVPGIAGSTILGDGRVIMIIDIVELIRTVQPSMVANSGGWDA